MEAKTCVVCNLEKPIKAFRVRNNCQYIDNYCMSCRARRERAQLRLAFLAAFNSTCSCCGENDPRFLTLDHINNDGNIHRETRKEHQIMRDAKNEGWPQNKYTCLCFNCNSGRSVNGGVCPHKCVSKEDYIKKLELDNFKLGKQFVNYNTSNVAARVAGRKKQVATSKTTTIIQQLMGQGLTDKQIQEVFSKLATAT